MVEPKKGTAKRRKIHLTMQSSCLFASEDIARSAVDPHNRLINSNILT
jgi:hypothetical protein